MNQQAAVTDPVATLDQRLQGGAARENFDMDDAPDLLWLMLLAQGDLAGALKTYRKDMAITARLAAANPSNAGWQRDLSVSHNKEGDVLRTQGDLPGALKAYRESLVIRVRLAATDPSNAGWQSGLGVSYAKMAQVSEALSPTESRDWWRKCYEQFFSMKQRGILNPTDVKLLDVARQKAEEVSSASLQRTQPKKPWWKLL